MSSRTLLLIGQRHGCGRFPWRIRYTDEGVLRRERAFRKVRAGSWQASSNKTEKLEDKLLYRCIQINLIVLRTSFIIFVKLMRWAQVTAFTITVRVKRLYKSVNMMLLESVVWTTFLFTFMKASIPEMGPTETPDMESGSGMILTGKMLMKIFIYI